MTKKRTIAISVLCMIAVLIGGFILGALVFTVDQYGKNWNWDFWSIAGFAVSILSILFGTFILFKAGKEYTTTLEDKLKNDIWVLKENWTTPGKDYYSTIQLLSAKNELAAIAELNAVIKKREKNNNFVVEHTKTMYCEYEADNYDRNHYEAYIKSYKPGEFIDEFIIVDDDHTNNNEETDKEES